MAANFPAYPTLLFTGEHVEEPERGVQRTEFEDGMVQQLQTSAKVLVKIPVQYRLGSKTDKTNFETFVEQTLHRGADWFNWTDPVDGQTKLARIVEGKVRWSARRKVLDRWIASFTIETWR